MVFNDIDVFVAASGQVRNDDGFRRKDAFLLTQPGKGMGAFESRQDAFSLREQEKGIENLFIFDTDVLGTACFLEVGVFRPDARVIQAGGDAFCIADLAVLVLKQIGASAVQNTDSAPAEGGTVLGGLESFAAAFHADQSDLRIVEKSRKDADGVGAAPHAGRYDVRQPAGLFKALSASFLPNGGLKVPHNRRIRMRTAGRSKQVEGVFDVGCPVSERFIDGIFEGSGSPFDGNDFRTEKPHFADVYVLTGHIGKTHKDFGFHSQKSPDDSRRQTVLAGTGFRTQFAFAHIAGQKPLSEGIVDFVSPAVEEIFSFEIDRKARHFAETSGVIEVCETSSIIRKERVQFLKKSPVIAKLLEGGFNFLKGWNKHFRHIIPAKRAESSFVFHLRTFLP